LKIGLAEEPRTLNVWLASDANSRKVLSLIYQPLYVYDPDTWIWCPGWLNPCRYTIRRLSYTVHASIGPMVGRHAIHVAGCGLYRSSDSILQGAPLCVQLALHRTYRDAGRPHGRLFPEKAHGGVSQSGTLATPIVQERNGPPLPKKPRPPKNRWPP
jgi:hypothetical protein